MRWKQHLHWIFHIFFLLFLGRRPISIAKYQFSQNLQIFSFQGTVAAHTLPPPASSSMRQQKHCDTIKVERLIGAQAIIFLLLNDFNGKTNFQWFGDFFFSRAAPPPSAEKIETITVNNNEDMDWCLKPKMLFNQNSMRTRCLGWWCAVWRWNTSSLFVSATTKWLIVGLKVTILFSPKNLYFMKFLCESILWEQLWLGSVWFLLIKYTCNCTAKWLLRWHGIGVGLGLGETPFSWLTQTSNGMSAAKMVLYITLSAKHVVVIYKAFDVFKLIGSNFSATKTIQNCRQFIAGIINYFDGNSVEDNVKFHGVFGAIQIAVFCAKGHGNGNGKEWLTFQRLMLW